MGVEPTGQELGDDEGLGRAARPDVAVRRPSSAVGSKKLNCSYMPTAEHDGECACQRRAFTEDETRTLEWQALPLDPHGLINVQLRCGRQCKDPLRYFLEGTFLDLTDTLPADAIFAGQILKCLRIGGEPPCG